MTNVNKILIIITFKITKLKFLLFYDVKNMNRTQILTYTQLATKLPASATCIFNILAELLRPII
jgi:hypothetical protein